MEGRQGSDSAEWAAAAAAPAMEQAGRTGFGSDSATATNSGGLGPLKPPMLTTDTPQNGGAQALQALPLASAPADGGLMIDGFMVPPHMLQALRQLRISHDNSAKETLADGGAGTMLLRAAPHLAADPDQENASRSCASTASPGSSPARRTSSSSAGSDAHVSSGSRCSRGRGSRSRPPLDAAEAEHVAGLEAAVEELTTRTTENAGIISCLGHDIVSLATTNEALRQRLLLLTSQLQNREVEIGALRSDVHRLRTIVTGDGASNDGHAASERI